MLPFQRIVHIKVEAMHSDSAPVSDTHRTGICHKEPIHSWLTVVIKAKTALYPKVKGCEPVTSWGGDRGNPEAKCAEG